jgi:HSP20 family protein
MAMFPARRTGRTLTDPSREFEDIYEPMGQLMNVASGDLAAGPADMPWSPAADLTETDDAYGVHVEWPGVHKDQLKVQLMDRSWRSPARSRSPPTAGVTAAHAGPAGSSTAPSSPATSRPPRCAELADGILTVAAPKSEAAAPSRIDVTDRPQSNG